MILQNYVECWYKEINTYIYTFIYFILYINKMYTRWHRALGYKPCYCLNRVFIYKGIKTKISVYIYKVFIFCFGVLPKNNIKNTEFIKF